MSPTALGSDVTQLSRDQATTDSSGAGALVLLALETVQRELEQLRGLPNGWDGGRARPIPDKTIGFAFDVFASMVRANDAVPAVVPTIKGGIQFEWHTTSFHVEIAVLRSARIEIYTVDRQTGDDELAAAAAPTEVRRILDGIGVQFG